MNHKDVLTQYLIFFGVILTLKAQTTQPSTSKRFLNLFTFQPERVIIKNFLNIAFHKYMMAGMSFSLLYKFTALTV